ncbi:MAG TPA: beta-ketoacyl-ACP synthase II [Polyangiaceae bacterium]|nr:beta-ketoacyl-ACP synthase II [Polyangiaceae bacterium]
MSRRVVVTGVGAVSPCGRDAVSTWAGVVEGRSGIRAITAFDAKEHASRIAGECWDFEPEPVIPKRELRTMDRFIQLALVASEEAMRGTGLAADAAIKETTGTLVGVGIGGLASIENMTRILAEKGPNRITPYFIPATISNLAPGQVSMRFGLKGPSFTHTSACSSGAHAIGEAFRAIVRGDMDACVAGGSEAAITPLGVAGFAAMRALSKRNDEPSRASRPWDVDRDGFVIAEGAGLLFLEEREHAVRRGATIHAELVGYGASADAHHLTQPAPEGEGAQRAMRAALADAKLEPSAIDYVNAHGTSTPAGDLLETAALRAVFGAHAAKGLWISSTKSVTGHLLGAAGGLEAVLSVLAVRDGIAPGTINLDRPDPSLKDLDLVPHESRRRPLRHVLSNSFGFGGTNAVLVFAKV